MEVPASVQLFSLYLVSNKTNGKLYVGWTGRGIETRLDEHCSKAKNGSKLYFHKALCKYGRKGFDWNVMKTFSTIEEVKQAEIDWIATLKEMGYELYNLTDGGEGTIGRICSDEARQNYSNAAKRRILSEETKQKLREYRIGIPLSDANKKLLSELYKGKPKSKEHCQNISKGLTGIKLSAETKQKISGENNHKALLKNKDAPIIRTLYATTNYTVKQLAKEYKVSKDCITDIIYNRTWKISEEEHMKLKETRKQNLLAKKKND